MNHIRNSYLAKYFKSFSFIPTLFIASITCTALVFLELFGIFDSMTLNNFTYYVTSTLAFFMLLYFVYSLARAKSPKLRLADSTNFAIMLTCVLYVIFSLFIMKKITLLRIVIPCGLFVITLFISTVRTVYFKPYENSGEVYYTKHSVNGYYHTLLKNYSFFGVLLFAIALTCIGHLIVSNGFIINFKSSSVIVPLVLAGLFFSLLIFTSISKKIGMLDFSILAMTIALIPTLTHILLLINNPQVKLTYLIYFVVCFGAVLIITILRYVFFDNSKIGKHTSQSFGDKKLSSFFKKLSHKYGITIIVTMALVETIYLVLLLRFADVNLYYKLIEDKVSINANLVPCLLANALFIGAIAISFILSVANVKATKITFGDFCLFTNIIFSILGAVYLLIKPIFDVRLYILCAILLISIIISIFRVVRVCPKDVDKI